MGRVKLLGLGLLRWLPYKVDLAHGWKLWSEGDWSHGFVEDKCKSFGIGLRVFAIAGYRIAYEGGKRDFFGMIFR